MHRAKKRIAWAAVALSTLAILVATLRSGGHTVASGWSFSLASGDAALAELIQNLLLFIPLGAALAWNGVRPLRAIAIGATLSFTVEFIQQWLPGRDPSVGDIVANTISTAIGVGLVVTAPRWLTVSPRRAAWQSILSATAAAMVWVGTGTLLRPIFPPPPYHAVGTPNFNYWGQYQGKVLSAHVGGGPLPLLETRIVAVAAPRRPSRPSPLVAVLDARDTRVLIVAVDLADLALLYHMRADELTLEQPDLRLRHALAPPTIAPGDTFTVTASRGCLSVNGAGRCGLGYTIGDGWKLIFYPEHFPAWAMTLLNALWVGGWMLGVGYWGRLAGHGPLIYAALGLGIVGLLVVPPLTGHNGTTVGEWIGGVGGVGVGYWLSIDRVLKDRLGDYTRP